MTDQPQPRRFRCRVGTLDALNHDTSRVRLTILDGGSFEYVAGQYLEILLPEKACPFSIASAPSPGEAVELHIRPTPDSEDSRQIEALIRSSKDFEIVAPKGDCTMVRPPEGPVLMLAASTGITQMKSFIEFMVGRGAATPVRLYWGVVAAEDLYLDELLRGWQETHAWFSYTPVVSDPDTSPGWRGRTGLVVDAAVLDVPELADYSAYIGGGPAMVQATVDALRAHGLPRDGIHSDMLPYVTVP